MISHVSTTSLSGLAHLSATYPSVQAGDLLVATLSSNSYGKAFVAKTGWTRAADGHVLWKLASGDESGSETFYTSDGSGLYIADGRLMQYRASAPPISLTGFVHQIATVSPISATISGVSGAHLLFASLGSDNGSSVSIGTPSGFTSRANGTSPGLRLADQDYESGSASASATFGTLGGGKYVWLDLFAFKDSDDSQAVSALFMGSF